MPEASEKMSYEQRLRDRLPQSGTITSIDVQPSDPNIRRVRVDGRAAARLTANEIDRLDLREDMAWDAQIAESIVAVLTVRKARHIAMKLLARRAFSTRAMQQRLVRRGFSAQTAQHVVDSLMADGWLDDETMASDLAESLCRDKPAGIDFLVQKIIQRDIDPDIARRAAEQTLNGRDPLDAAKELAEQRLARMSGAVSNAAKARRIAGALGRRGFDEHTIQDVLEQLNLTEP